MIDNLLRFLLGYMEDVRTQAQEENPHIAAIVQKHLEALKADLNEHSDLYPIDDE
jgi:hypothetical protein